MPKNSTITLTFSVSALACHFFVLSCVKEAPTNRRGSLADVKQELDDSVDVDPAEGTGVGNGGADNAEFEARANFLRPSVGQYQSRSVIRLSADAVVIAGADFRLVNISTGKTLEQRMSSDLSRETFDDPQLSLTEMTAFAPIVAGLGIAAGQLQYGRNDLRLLVAREGQENLYGDSQIAIVDFPIFSSAMAVFPNNSQTSDGFQGWVTPIVGAELATAEPAHITVGFFHIVNE